jgi:hypothetical protein
VAKDYTANITTAQRLITKFGRSITLVQLNDTVTDSAKPWDGVNPTNPRTTPDSTLILDAVFVFPTGLLNLGLGAAQQDMLARSTQIAIVSAGAAVDLSDYSEIIDTDGTTWTIGTVEMLRPASDTVLGYLGVRR